jgi:hypothetical protein
MARVYGWGSVRHGGRVGPSSQVRPHGLVLTYHVRGVRQWKSVHCTIAVYRTIHGRVAKNDLIQYLIILIAGFPDILGQRVTD